MSIKVIITDDHPLAISGLQNMLSLDKEIEILNCYESGVSLLEGLKMHQPDVLLLDVELPDYKGYDLTDLIKQQYPDIKILAITSHDAPILVKRMMHKGCNGYVLKNTRAKDLLHAIRQVFEGEEYIEPSLKEQMIQNINQFKKQNSRRIPVLTQREREVLKLIVQEYTNQEIADKLFVSVRTVENHRFSLLHKLDVKNSIGLVRVAIQFGMV